MKKFAWLAAGLCLGIAPARAQEKSDALQRCFREERWGLASALVSMELATGAAANPVEELRRRLLKAWLDASNGSFEHAREGLALARALRTANFPNDPRYLAEIEMVEYDLAQRQERRR